MGIIVFFRLFFKLFNGDWGYLNDRNGHKLSYFGGGPSGGTGCACGTTGTCRDNTYKCNCDANLATLLSDSGHITDKSVLPLTRIYLSNSLSGGYGYFSIGKLECIGKLARYQLRLGHIRINLVKHGMNRVKHRIKIENQF